MRRSSIVALAVACLILALGVLMWSLTSVRAAPPLTPRLAGAMLERGKQSIERKDVDAIMALFTEDARILQRTPSQIRGILEQTMKELGDGSLTVTYSRLDVKPTHDGALVSVSLDVSQRFANADASYYRPRLRLVMRKERKSRFLGLLTVEEWRISQLDSDETFDLRRS
jgi:ketosteroid isomerase-like protein